MKKIGLLLFFLPLYTQGQIINTIAGCGISGYFGDGAQATAAQLAYPRDIVMDRHGNIFFTEISNHVVRKLDPSGIISTIAGNGTPGFSGDSGFATIAQLTAPVGLAVDKINNIYICDINNLRIRKVDTSGIITTIAGTGLAGYNGDSIPATSANLSSPSGVCVDSIGNVYIADHLNNRIRKVNTAGVISTIAGTGLTGSTGDGGLALLAQINPVGIVLDKNYDMYISEGNKIRKITHTTGIISTIAGTGVGGFSGDGGSATSAMLGSVEGFFVDDTGNVYLPDGDYERVRKIDALGIIKTIAGNGHTDYNGDGGYADTSTLYGPTGVVADSNGRIYIADQGHNRVRCIGCLTKEAIEDIASGSNELFSISPNPLTENTIKILVSSQRKEEVKIVLRNEVGQVVRETVITANQETEWELDVPDGIYFVQAIASEGSQTKKIVVGFH